jgi:hypothetical protein
MENIENTIINPLTVDNIDQHCEVDSLKKALLTKELLTVESDKFYLEKDGLFKAISCGVVETENEEDLLNFIEKQLAQDLKVVINRIYRQEDKIEMICASLKDLTIKNQ